MDANAFTTARFNQVNLSLSQERDRVNAGFAGAMAAVNIPQAWSPGQALIGVGLGTKDGQTALAIGGSTVLGDGHTSIKASAAFDSQSSASAGIGLGWQF